MNDPMTCDHFWPHSNGDPERCYHCGRCMTDLDLIRAAEVVLAFVKRETVPPKGWRRDFRSEAYRNEP